MTREKILVVDDEENVCGLFARVLRKQGYDVDTACDGESALEKLGKEGEGFGLVITDLKMPGMDGMEVARRVRELSGGRVDVMVVTGYGTIESAVEAMRIGVVDYLTKPLDINEMRRKVGEVMKRRSLEKEVEMLRGRLRGRDRYGELVGSSPPMQRLYELIDRTKDADCNVLIWGESGAGKELVARAIHFGGKKKDAPFVAINCGALPESILERELFGHAKGAYTGADESREGYFQAAHGGTLFLDEVTALGESVQVKLLRAIEEKQVYRLGDPKPVPVDVRILAATNEDPARAVEEGRFRRDLYFRLNVVPVYVPPLRERKEDIPLLVEHLLERIGARYGRESLRLGREAMESLYAYDWPGNVRELENVLERAVVLLAPGASVIERVDLPAREGEVECGSGVEVPFDGRSLQEAKRQVVRDFEVSWIRQALQRTGGNVSEAARLLGLGRTALQRLLRKYGISSKEFK